MSLPFAATRRVHVQARDGVAAEIEIRQLTIGDFSDQKLAESYGALTEYLIHIAQSDSRGALSLGASAVGHLCVCLRVCATIIDGPPNWTIDCLTPRALSPLASVFAELHFFDEASLTALGLRATMLAPLMRTIVDQSSDGSTDSARSATSSSGAATPLRMSP